MSRSRSITACAGLGALHVLLTTLTAGAALGAAMDEPSPTRRERQRAPAHRPNTVLVKFKEGVAREQMSAIVQAQGARETRWFRAPRSLRRSPIERWERLTLDPGQDAESVRLRLAQHPAVEAAELDAVVSICLIPNDPAFSQLWGLHNTGQTGGTPDADIDAPEAWDLTTGDHVVVVAVIDTGIDLHPSRPGRQRLDQPRRDPRQRHRRRRQRLRRRRARLRLRRTTTATPSTTTATARTSPGTIGALGNNGGVIGVTWNSRIMALKFLSADGTGYVSDAIAAVLYAAAMGANVINNSWGGDLNVHALEDAIAAADGQGCSSSPPRATTTGTTT